MIYRRTVLIKRALLLLTIFAMLNGPLLSAVSAAPLHSAWSMLLEKYVKDGGVDYVGFKKDEASLDEYLAFLDAADPLKLSTDEQLALYINAYNSYTVKLILDHFEDGQPVSSIKKIGGFFTGPWKIKFCRVGGEVYSLDNIEHDIIRPLFKEPRIHFAVNCASKSCPPLISEAYEADILELQLNANTIAFVNNAKFNYVEGSNLYISKIFTWFAEDFDNDPLGFIAQYAKSDFKESLAKLGSSVNLNYLDYDWSLNSRAAL